MTIAAPILIPGSYVLKLGVGPVFPKTGAGPFVIPPAYTHHSDNRRPRRWMTPPVQYPRAFSLSEHDRNVNEQHQQAQGNRHRAARERHSHVAV